MAIPKSELKVNDIVLAPDKVSIRRCIVKVINDSSVVVDYLNMQTGEMESLELIYKELEPVHLMESTLYVMGFKKADVSECNYPADKCYILKKNGHSDIVAIYIGQWHLFLPNDNGSFLDKQELYLHTLQNYLSMGKEVADEVNYEKFLELTNPYCVSPFEPKEE